MLATEFNLQTKPIYSPEIYRAFCVCLPLCLDVYMQILVFFGKKEFLQFKKKFYISRFDFFDARKSYTEQGKRHTTIYQ